MTNLLEDIALKKLLVYYCYAEPQNDVQFEMQFIFRTITKKLEEYVIQSTIGEMHADIKSIMARSRDDITEEIIHA